MFNRTNDFMNFIKEFNKLKDDNEQIWCDVLSRSTIKCKKGLIQIQPLRAMYG